MEQRIGVLLVLVGLPVWAGCESSTDVPDPGDLNIVLTEVVSGLERPTTLTAPPGDSRLFVTEQSGRVLIIEDGVVLEPAFLDLSELTEAREEQGLLGLAFHPDYTSNGRFFVNYTDVPVGDTRVVEYQVGSDPNVADPASAQEILFIQQPGGHHNGGHLEFGPDGMLFVATGDGGGAFDAFENGQNVTTLHGGILRLDVSVPGPAAIPPNNPFAGSSGGEAEELWAWGLRNPWRFSFDPDEGLLYIADVGQNRWEEVNVVPSGQPGLNFGWSIMEGPECLDPDACDPPADLIEPALYYSIVDNPSCAIIGGAVYRGSRIPELQGHYLYSDFCAGFLRSFRFDGGVVHHERDWGVHAGGPVNSMGRDAFGELYVLTFDGRVLQVDAES